MEYYVGATFMNRYRHNETYALVTLLEHSVLVYELIQLTDNPTADEKVLKDQLFHAVKLIYKIAETRPSAPVKYLEKLIISDYY